MKSRLLLFLVAPVVACGDSGTASTPDALVAFDAAAPPDAVAVPPCQVYPIPWAADADTHTAAELDLATLSATAALTWNDNTGTLSTLFQLDHPLGCASGEDVNTKVMAFLTEHPTLFQLDAAEWQVPPPYDCQFIPTDLQILSMGRTRLANHPLARDTLAYSVKRVDTDIVLTSVIATYVPPAIDGLDQAMTSCADFSAAAAEAEIRATALPARTFDLCAPTGELAYTPQAGDTVELRDDGAWSWQEDTGGVLLTGTRTVRVTVAPEHYTAELLASDARCPVLDPTSEDYTVGFDITIDIHTGEILFVKPGLDCVVC